MADVKYTRDHEWIRLDGDVGVVGITTYAQSQLGDVVYVELPAIGRRLEKGAEAAVVESVKAASEVYSPVGGEVVAVNDALEAAPALVNEDAEGKGWFLKLKVADPKQLDALMNAAQGQATHAGFVRLHHQTVDVDGIDSDQRARAVAANLHVAIQHYRPAVRAGANPDEVPRRGGADGVGEGAISAAALGANHQRRA